MSERSTAVLLEDRVVCRDLSPIIRHALLVEPSLRLALVYGSYVTGKMHAESDVDLAVLFDRPLSVERRMNLMERLEKSLSKTVDLVDLYLLNGTILRRILCTGQVLVKNDTAALPGLVRRMVYNEADMMPIVQRTLKQRLKRFLHG
jgi:predicted nucleotidyltransferase